MRQPFASRQLLLTIVPIIAHASTAVAPFFCPRQHAFSHSNTQRSARKLPPLARKRKNRDRKSDACRGVGGANNDLPATDVG